MTVSKLSELALPTKRVRVNDTQELEVGGISFHTLAQLFNQHGPTLALIYGQFVEAKGAQLTPQSFANILRVAMTDFSEVVHSGIAIACGEPDGAKTVARLPLPIQAELLEAVVELTFQSEADVKKLIEIVTRGMVGTASAMTALTAKTPSSNGAGSFANG